MAKVTLKTLAEYTGLSVTTVSRALKDGDDVKQPTKDTVKAAAKKLGYRPNPSGAGLRTGINHNICAILPVPKPGDIIGDVGSLALIEGLTAGLKDTPYQLNVLPMLPGESPIVPVKYAYENNLCGGMLFNLVQTQDERVAYLHDKAFPFVTFGQTEMSIEHPFVDVDNLDMGYRAAKRLIEQGRKYLRLMTYSKELTYVWHQYFGIRRAAMEAGIPFDWEENVLLDVNVEDYRLVGQQLARQADPPDGIICGSEVSACGVMSGLQDAGKVVGKDVDVVAVEGCDLPSFFIPPISGYRQDFHRIGRILIDHLLRRISCEPVEALQTLEKTTFVER